MDKLQADTFMKVKKNRELWIMEATGSFNKPYKTKYKEGMLYILWDNNDTEIEVYDTANIYGECEYAIPITSTGQIKF